MSDVLAQVLDAEGGLENWVRVVSVDVRLTLIGSLFEIEGYADGLRTTLMEGRRASAKNPDCPLPERGKRGLFEPGRLPRAELGHRANRRLRGRFI